MTTLLATVEELAGEQLQVSGDAYRHLFRARRLKSGESLRVVDGAGRARWATVAEVGRREATLTLGGSAPANEPRRRVALLAAVPRPARCRWLVEKSTEVGVAAVHFVDCERSTRRLDAEGLERLRRVAAAAVEQSERALVPAITGTHPAHEWKALLAGAECIWTLDPGGEERLGPGAWSSAALVVGPEGGFSAAETERLAALGGRRAGLGPTTLRVETAAVIAVFQALSGV